MNQGQSTNQSHKMRYPYIFPETRTSWENTRNKINDLIDGICDSENPLQLISQKIKSYSSKILQQK